MSHGKLAKVTTAVPSSESNVKKVMAPNKSRKWRPPESSEPAPAPTESSVVYIFFQSIVR